MKKFVKLLLPLALVFALVLTGCGNQGTASNTPAPASNAPASAAPTDAAPNTETPSTSSGFPSSSIQVIVPFSAGGGTDLFARIVVDKMSQIMGVPVEVVNKPGGSATIGATEVANADKAGYTIGFSISTPLCVAPHYGETSYKFEDFTPICNGYTVLHGIYVSADSPIQNEADLIKYINDNGGVVSYAGSGTGNMQHLCLEEWAAQANPEGTWNLTNVPYDGDPEEIVALMSGELPFATLQVHGAKAAVEAGNIRGIMIFGEPTPNWITEGGYEIPNSAELGYTNQIKGLVGFYGPKDMDPDAVAAISAACKEALEDPEVIEAIANIGLEPDYRDSTAYADGLSELVPVAKDMLVELGFLAG